MAEMKVCDAGGTRRQAILSHVQCLSGPSSHSFASDRGQSLSGITCVGARSMSHSAFELWRVLQASRRTPWYRIEKLALRVRECDSGSS
jgi:hypothetical protein